MSWFIDIDVGSIFTDFTARQSKSGRSCVHERPSTPGNPAQLETVDGVQVHLIDITQPAFVEVQPDETVIIETAGASGYGPRALRNAEEMAEDPASRKLSTAYFTAYPGFPQKAQT